MTKFTFEFELGQLNAGGQMTVNPVIHAPLVEDVGHYDVECKVNWICRGGNPLDSAAGSGGASLGDGKANGKPDEREGFFKLFRYHLDSKELSDVKSSDIKIKTDTELMAEDPSARCVPQSRG